MTVLIILREAKGQPVCHHPHCCSVSASPDRHCSCPSDLCSCALFSEGPREPAGAPSCPGCTVGEGAAHLQAEPLRHVQLSRFLTATCRFMLSMLEAPWMVCLSRCWTFVEPETTKEHTPGEESQLLCCIDLSGRGCARAVFQPDGVLEASGFFSCVAAMPGLMTVVANLSRACSVPGFGEERCGSCHFHLHQRPVR